MTEVHAYDDACSCSACNIHRMIDDMAVQAAKKILKQEEAARHKETSK